MLKKDQLTNENEKYKTELINTKTENCNLRQELLLVKQTDLKIKMLEEDLAGINEFHLKNQAVLAESHLKKIEELENNHIMLKEEMDRYLDEKATLSSNLKEARIKLNQVPLVLSNPPISIKKEPQESNPVAFPIQVKNEPQIAKGNSTQIMAVKDDIEEKVRSKAIENKVDILKQDFTKFVEVFARELNSFETLVNKTKPTKFNFKKLERNYFELQAKIEEWMKIRKQNQTDILKVSGQSNFTKMGRILESLMESLGKSGNHFYIKFDDFESLMSFV